MEINHNALMALIVLAALSASTVLAQDVLTVQKQGNVSFVAGGIGEEETEALKASKHLYNLRIMNTTKTGHYVGDPRIIVRDANQNVLLDAMGGPFLYANLPNGKYVVEGITPTQNVKKTVTVSGNKAATLHFVWQQDASNE
jgi:hypothetical protein